MIIEWKLLIGCNYKCDYCKYDKHLKDILKIERDETVLAKFIDSFNKQNRLYVFGGEPFLHPKIDFIINRLIDNRQKFLVQTNYSTLSVLKIKEINRSFEVNISIHPNDVSLGTLLNNLKESVLVDITQIDIMYIGEKSLEYYDALRQNGWSDKLSLHPIGDFKVEGYYKHLKEYNKLKKSPIYRSLYNFEEMYINYYKEERSIIWQKYMEGSLTTYNKPCIYKDKFIMYDSELNNYNCCYVTNHEGLCKEKYCYLMENDVQ